MNFLKKGLIFGGLAGILLSGCGKNEIEPLPEPENPQPPQNSEPAPVYENVETLSESELKNISSVDANSIYFATPTDFKKGEIIIGGISEKTPGGILRKVSSVSADNKKVTTSPASLEEVIQEGDFFVDERLTLSDLEEGSKLKSASSHEFYYPIENTVIFDLDNDLNTTNDQITMDGGVYFDLNYEFHPIFKKGVKSVRFSTSIKQKAELNFAGNLDKEINEEINLYRQSFVPFVIPTPLAIPLVLRPRLELNAGVIGEIHGEARARVEEDFIAKGTLYYLEGSWKNDENLNKTFGAEFLGANANANFKGYVSPRLDLIVNEIAGPFASAEGYLEINVDTQNNPWWELYGGVNVTAGIDMGLLSRVIPDYEKDLIEYRELICCAEGEIQSPNQAPSANFVISPESGTPQTMFNFDANSTTDDKTPPEELFYRWDFEGDGAWDSNWTQGKTLENHLYGEAGTYSPTLEVKDIEGEIDSYNKVLTVESESESQYSTFTDPIDGQKYDIINIDGDWWFAENFARYLPNAYYPNKDSINNHSYGRLYHWEDTERVCPEGWHIPNIMEWYNMMNSLDNTGMFNDNIMGQEIGDILKEKGTVHWAPGNGGRDEIGFGIVGAGYNWVGGSGYHLGKTAYLWSSTGYRSDDQWCVLFDYDNDASYKFPMFKAAAYSLRFVKD
jgi:uncharacterized protein (TIGR02145 family)